MKNQRSGSASCVGVSALTARHYHVRAIRPRVGLGLLCLLALSPVKARAACDIIPSATTTFRAALGSTDRPFAGPDDVIEVRTRPGVCDGASPGFSDTTDDLVISLVFVPPGGSSNVVVLANDCTAIASCSGAASTTCIAADAPGHPKMLQIADRDGEHRLLIRFPDTDALQGAASDDHTFAGPVKIVVKDRSF